MAVCGIHRVEKRKATDVGGLQAEANRTISDEGKDFKASDIDWERTRMNERLVSSDNWLKDIKQAIHDAGIEKYRKDAVVMLDGLYTASPEFFQDKTRAECMEYFKECLEFHKRNYGIVINAVVHFDEKTPHMQVCSVPLVQDADGKARLSAKDIMGNRAEYQHKQDMFFEQVTERYGLERGEPKLSAAEKREHLSVQDYKIQKNDERMQEQKQKIADNKQVIQGQKETYDKRKETLQNQAEKIAGNKTTIDKQKAKIKENNVSIKEQASKVKAVGDYMQSAYGYHKPFGKKDMVMYHENAEKINKEFQAEFDDKVRDFMAMPNNTRYLNEQAKKHEQETKEALKKAEQELARAEELKQEQESYILGTAERLVDERFKGKEDSYTKRLEDFVKSYSVDDKSLFDVFKELEQELALKIKNSLHIGR